MLLLLAAALLQSEVTVEDKGEGKFDLRITATMAQLPVAKQRMQAAMKKTCGKPGIASIDDPLIINTDDVPMRFIIMQGFTCKPAR